MSLRLPLILAQLGLTGLLTAPAVADAQPPAADGQRAHEVLAAFGKGDPGWKDRMRALVRVARLGPDAVPPLIEALESGPPPAREFAAHALGVFADPRARPALQTAYSGTNPAVRLYAVQALRLMGPLEPAEKWEKRRSEGGRDIRTLVAGALDWKEQPSPQAVRKAWAGYDLAKMGSARVGELAPDFTLAALSGKTYRLGDFRGKKEVVLRYFKLDY